VGPYPQPRAGVVLLAEGGGGGGDII